MCPVMEMAHDGDPVEDIFERIGSLDDIVLPANKVLVGIYMRPTTKKVAGTNKVIHLTDSTVAEDMYQGKAGLVLKCGAAAFKGDWRTEGFSPKPGDWVAFRPSDGFKLDIRSENGHCILLDDTKVQMIIPAPDLVF